MMTPVDGWRARCKHIALYDGAKLLSACKLLNIENNRVIHRGPMKIKKNGGNVIMLI